jgi:hypothetical protein
MASAGMKNRWRQMVTEGTVQPPTPAEPPLVVSGTAATTLPNTSQRR